MMGVESTKTTSSTSLVRNRKSTLSERLTLRARNMKTEPFIPKDFNRHFTLSQRYTLFNLVDAKVREMEEETKRKLKECEPQHPGLYAFIKLQKDDFTPYERFELFTLVNTICKPTLAESMVVALKMMGESFFHCEDDSDCSE